MKPLSNKVIKKSFLLAFFLGISFSFFNINYPFLFLIVFITGIIAVLLNKVIYRNIFKGAPNVNTPNIEQFKEILKNLEVKKAVDLGCGYGNIVKAISELEIDIDIDGYDINPLAYFICKIRNIKNVYLKNFWNVNLNKYDFIYVFGIPHIMKDLENKILKEAKKNTHVLSFNFEFKKLKKVKQSNNFYLYKV